MYSTSRHSLRKQPARDEQSRASPMQTLSQHETSSDTNVNVACRPTGIPHELDGYLTVTNQPHEIFESLQDSRDRRLRLLLRRFYNQIQYGCRNPYCHIPTCLSYRKRVAIAPLRPFSDIAARALALHCVEQYAESDEGHTQSHAPVSSGKRKLRTHPYSSVSGLCWSTPMIPWYGNPPEAGHKKGTLEHQARARDSRSQQNHSCLSPELSPATNEMARTTDQRQSSQQSGSVSVSQYGQTETKIDNNVVLTSPTQTNDLDQRNDSDVSQRESSYDQPGHIPLVEPLEEHSLHQKDVIRDQASFAQTVYDTLIVKDLHRLRGRDEPLTNKTLPFLYPGQSRPQRSSTLDEVLADTKAIHIHSSESTSEIWTFELLPLSVVLWLRSTMPYDSLSSQFRDLNVTECYGPHSPLARQSLHFCLSNPRRLLKSATTWHYVHPRPQKLNEDERTQIIRDIAAKETTQLGLPVMILPEISGIMVAFGMLIAITSIPEVLGHLFAALQYAYIPPPWLERVRQREYTSSRLRSTAEDTGSEHGTGVFFIKNLFPLPDISNIKSRGPEFLEDKSVAQLCMLAFLSLQLVSALKTNPFSLMHTLLLKELGEYDATDRKSGAVFPYASLFKAWSSEANARLYYEAYTSRLDTVDHWSHRRILDCFADIISHRLAIMGICKANKGSEDFKPRGNIVEMFINEMSRSLEKPDNIVYKKHLPRSLISMLRTLIVRRWNREAVIQKRGPVGGALELLAALFRKKTEFDIPIADFQWAFVGDAFDEVDMPVKWLDFRDDNVQTHILAYPFLFEPATLVTYFRAINSVTMKRSRQHALANCDDAYEFLKHGYYNIYGAEEVLAEMRPAMARFFVLTIRRSHMLQDAIDQVWRRQRQELLRPLKVRLGREEGENGLDHGGVQAEFFRVIFAEALRPDYGMFTIDERSKMTWLQPRSMEPLYKFEVLGILMSLAVYNGITLPITFPLAFYRKLLGMKVKTLAHIGDGWPDLTRSLKQLLVWNKGDVGDVMSLSYEFFYEAYGAPCTVDMIRNDRDDPWPKIERSKSREKLKTASFEFPPGLSPKSSIDMQATNEFSHSPGHVISPSPTSVNGTTILCSHSNSTPSLSEGEAEPVTNANRDIYVKDYIYWLVHKSISPQFTAFATGFFTCLDRTALSIFTPEHLQTVIEGYQYIDIDGLQATATYDEYEPTDDVIHWFWQVVRDMSTLQHRHLLEFVTASDRVPVSGIESIAFIVQKNGESDERLPSSSTCYGRLLLPKYSSKAVLREKLEKAIENSTGFGSL